MPSKAALLKSLAAARWTTPREALSRVLPVRRVKRRLGRVTVDWGPMWERLKDELAFQFDVPSGWQRDRLAQNVRMALTARCTREVEAGSLPDGTRVLVRQHGAAALTVVLDVPEQETAP